MNNTLRCMHLVYAVDAKREFERALANIMLFLHLIGQLPSLPLSP